PLGASDLRPAIEKSLQSFSKDRAGSIVYIGDGMSTAGIVATQEMRDLIGDLRDRQIPVHSYAVGPQIDHRTLGVLAEHTGGVLLLDEILDDARVTPAELGGRLARAATALVLYPESLTISPDVDRVLPHVCPPLRADRDAILLGKGEVAASVIVRAQVDGRTMEWTVKPAVNQKGNTYLSRLWSVAESDDGLSIAVAGTDLLHQALQEFEDEMALMAAAGKRAVQTRKLNEAEQIAWAIRQADPENDQADQILTASQRLRGKIRTVQFGGPPEPGLGAEPADASAREENIVDREVEAKRVRGQQLNQQVKRKLADIDKSKRREPEVGLSELKRMLNTINSSTDVDSNDREANRIRVQKKIEELMTVQQQVEAQRIYALERLAALESQRLTADQLVLRDERLTSLIEKVRALMNEGFTGNEMAFEQAELVARTTIEVAPYNGVSWQSIFVTEAANQLDRIMRLRLLRSDKFLEALYLVEKAHVPFPDEPPLLYPPPEVWQQLTQRRKKWNSVDLTKYSPKEEKLREALSRPTDVNFADTSLKEAIEFLAKSAGIDIVIDQKAIEDANLTADMNEENVNLNLSGVTLRSILKLLLNGKDLTWLIEDEVMKITTTAIAEAEGSIKPRVYPVGDLVIAPQMLSGSGGGGFGGGNGGIGGGLGGGGGGFGGGGQQGGGGGGFGGGGQGGGGGGFFDIDSAAPRTPATTLKKKLTND
ncbi:MAG: hypothetical protein NT069_16275, partial [Planctomycetota bacterium]|nr:hypothetical protein [Planctomycetota bacterium]